MTSSTNFASEGNLRVATHCPVLGLGFVVRMGVVPRGPNRLVRSQ